MQVQTLDELKAENEQDDNKEVDVSATDTNELDSSSAEDNQDNSIQNADSEDDESGSETVELWRQSDDSEHFDSKDMAGMRKKWKAKLEDQKEESESVIAQLMAENERLKNGAQQQKVMPMPTLESCDYDEAKLADEMHKYFSQQTASQIQQAQLASQQQEAQAAQQKEHESRMNSHYERVARLAKDSGIEPETYRAGELAVRKAVKSVPNFSQGNLADTAVDTMISKLGEGSEKLMYYLGRNSEARDKFRMALVNDPTGIEAGILLGEMKASISQPTKRRTSAKPPAKSARGEGGNVSSWQRKYDKAKSTQERFDIRREAKRAGVKINH
jgi:hypothetical protein